MRNPAVVLKSLEENAQNKEYAFERLYRNLYNPDFYMLAYNNIAKSQGSMTQGSDGMTLDNMTKSRINKIIDSLKDHSYQPNPARRTYIEKKNSDKKRPLGIPSTDDKLVQEIIHMLLQAIYEPTSSKNSHGFRPKRSCLTALFQIQSSFLGTKWFIEGDIKACFDSFDHHVLINLLRKRIKDEYFIALMWKFLKAGYMEQWTYFETYSGTPQGSGMSPILANIYLHELDMFMQNYKVKFDKGDREKRIVNKDYSKISGQFAYRMRKYCKARANLTREERKQTLKPILKLRGERAWMQIHPIREEGFKRLQYNRYADDFLIGVIGSEQDALQLKSELAIFLQDTLKLTLSAEKTKVTHSAELVRYLGYDITISRNKGVKRNKKGALAREWYGNVELYLPKEKWVAKLQEYKTFRYVYRDDGKEIWKTLHRGKLVNWSDVDIISRYNSEIRGIYNYYRLANNVSILNSFAFIMSRSMQKTFACKYKSTCSKMRKKYTVNKVFGVEYKTKGGMKRCEFYHDGFQRKNIGLLDDENVDILPVFRKYQGRNSLAMRLNAGKCEVCGTETEDIHMHHVRTMKQLTGANIYELTMLKIRRKSLALCAECYDKAKQ